METKKIKRKKQNKINNEQLTGINSYVANKMNVNRILRMNSARTDSTVLTV